MTSIDKKVNVHWSEFDNIDSMRNFMSLNTNHVCFSAMVCDISKLNRGLGFIALMFPIFFRSGFIIFFKISFAHNIFSLFKQWELHKKISLI